MKIYSDRKYLIGDTPHVVMLYPFWGKNPEDSTEPTAGKFDKYAQSGNSIFQLSPIEDADLAVLPFSFEHIYSKKDLMDLALQFSKMACEENKKIAIFYWSDWDYTVPIDNAVIFRTSLYRSIRKPYEFSMPAWSEDLLEKYLGGKIPIRRKGKRPIVGFCGLSAPPNKALRTETLIKIKWIRDQIVSPDVREKYRFSPYIGHAIRGRCLGNLSRDSSLETNFIIRKTFGGVRYLPDGRIDTQALMKEREDYVQNMIDSDYILCCRGAGNYSNRLYETLCCGRIPIIIDTDCVLPYDFEVDWKKFCVWVDETEIDSITEKVLQFHERFSEEEFIDLQRTCRMIWQDYLCPEGFFERFHRHFVSC